MKKKKKKRLLKYFIKQTKERKQQAIKTTSPHMQKLYPAALNVAPDLPSPPL